MAPGSSGAFTDWLRATTRAEHAALESTAFARALAERRLPLAAYVGMLEALAVVHEVVERAAETVGDATLRRVWDPTLARAAALRADLDHFGRQDFPEPRRAVEAALRLTDRALERSLADPVSLVGYVYTLVGAAQGQASMAPVVAELYGLDRRGRAYLTAYDPDPMASLRRLKARVDAEPWTVPARHEVRDAVREVYGGFRAIFDALHPRAPEGGLTAMSLNPEAGRHAIPKDPREIGAAAWAGRQSWLEFPYFEARYGERGRRFTLSDGAWLVTLCELPADQVDSQVAWLVRVLAARGMPSVLMERHLELLHEQLVADAPADPGRYAPLRGAAERLAAARRSRLSDARVDALAQRFEAQVAALDGAAIPRVAPLVASAVVDEALGRAGAVRSLVGWLQDPDRFGPAWVDAVGALLDSLRAEVGLSDDAG